MMVDQLTEEQATKAVDHWGGCPECHTYDCYLNVERTHWFVCHTHKKKWCVGWNLMSSWRDETQEQWDRNAARIADYEEIEPWMPERSAEDIETICVVQMPFERA
jgi:hypothetical protein